MGTPLGLLRIGEGLRDVVAHAGEDHVVGDLGCTADTGPGFPGEIAVDHLILQATVFGAGGETVGEARRSLEDRPGDAGAVLGGAGSETRVGRGYGLGVAAGVDGGGGGVADQETGGVAVEGALRVLAAEISVGVELLCGMGLKREQSLSAVYQREGAVGVNGGIGQVSGTVAPDTVSDEAVEA